MSKKLLEGMAKDFCGVYLDTMDARRAAEQAGTENGYELLSRKDVQRYLERLRKSAGETVKPEDVIRRLCQIAFSRPNDAVALACGQKRGAVAELDLAAVAEFKYKEDSPSLSEDIKRRYRNSYTGTFYRRFILGEWTQAQGLVYDFFDRTADCMPPPEEACEEYAVSVDYGTANPASFGLWGRRGEIWYRINEYYYASRREGRQKTDAEYVEDLWKLLDGRKPTVVIVDPSAASFIEALRRTGLRVQRADNDVLSGIRLTAGMLKEKRIVLCSNCVDCLREMELYCWDGREGRDAPRKEHDHAMDEMRYFAAYLAGKEESGGFFAAAVMRKNA